MNQWDKDIISLSSEGTLILQRKLGWEQEQKKEGGRERPRERDEEREETFQKESYSQI